MRRAFRTARAFVIVLSALVCGACALLLVVSPVFRMGERYEVYYGDSSSSLMEKTDDPLAAKLAGGVVGESVRYTGDRYQELKAAFSARELFSEEACGVTNHYLYSPYLGAGVALKGYVVNLHIAVSAEETAAGTPLIFGGF